MVFPFLLCMHSVDCQFRFDCRILNRETLSKIFILFTIAVLLSSLGSKGYCYGHHYKGIATGGPFVAKRKRVQSFAAKFRLSAEEAKKPMMLIVHNGFGDKPGFEWLRIFLCGDINTNLDKYEEPQGDLVFDDNYVQKHTISIDITDLVEEGTNTIYIEGKGKKGSVLSWTLNSTVSPTLAPLNPSETFLGAKLTLSGRGFSQDKDENVVSLQGRKLKILSASRGKLTVAVPTNLKPGPSKLTISTNGIESKSIPVNIKPTPIVVSIKKLNRRLIEISGRHLKAPLSKTEVYLGNYRTKVIEVSENTIKASLPDLLLASGAQNMKVRVVVDGVYAQGRLFFDQSVVKLDKMR